MRSRFNQKKIIFEEYSFTKKDELWTDTCTDEVTLEAVL